MQTLSYYAAANPEDFDPDRRDRAGINTAHHPMFQGLLAFKRDTTELQPQWASSGQISADADEFLTPNLRCAVSQSGVKFCNQNFDPLSGAARATTDSSKRLALYENAQEIFKPERPCITNAAFDRLPFDP